MKMVRNATTKNSPNVSPNQFNIWQAIARVSCRIGPSENTENANPPKSLAATFPRGNRCVPVLNELRCVIGLGANLGDMLATFESTVELLTRVGSVERVSHLYESAPVGGPAQPDYFNAAVLLRSTLTPRNILADMLRIERDRGRVRGVRWGPRLLDLDLLWIDGVIVDEPGLKVPHPRLIERNFALFPLVDVAPDAREPNTGRVYAEMRKNHCAQGIRLYGLAQPRTDDWLAGAPRKCLWQMADLGT